MSRVSVNIIVYNSNEYILQPPALSQIRLVGGANDNEGAVEMTYMGTRGMVCDDSWNISSGHVVCRMLGFM